MVDGGGLENHCTRKGTGGSNPSPSANVCNLLTVRRLARRREAFPASLLSLHPARVMQFVERKLALRTAILSAGIRVRIDGTFAGLVADIVSLWRLSVRWVRTVSLTSPAITVTTQNR